MAGARRQTVVNADLALREIVASIDRDAGGASARARALIRDQPDLAIAHRVLAAALRRLGNVREAESAELRAIAIGLRHPAVAAAERAIADERFEEAERSIRPYLRENPEDAGGALILGTIAEKCGATKEAENLYRRAFMLAPAYLEARIALFKLLNQAGRQDEAAIILDDVLARDPNHLPALSLKGNLLLQSRRMEEAQTVYRRLVRAHPDDGRGWMGHAFILKTIGRIDEAIAAYRKAVDLEPQRGNAWFGLANLKTVRFDRVDIDRMKSALDHDDQDDDDLLHLHFALGKALHDHGDFDEAFAHYQHGSALRRQKTPYDPEVLHANVLKAEAVFTPEFFAARADTGFPARDPIFIVSLPRSGSTLVEQILASHPAIEGTEELFDLERIARELAPDAPAGGYLDRIADLSHAALHERGRHYIEATRRHRQSDRALFTDKMPSNWVFTGLIHAILPNAKIVDVRRDPMGCGFANFSQHYNWGINFSYDLTDIGRYYADYVRMMDHFDRVLPGRIHRVMYEGLVDDLETEVRRLLDYLELPFDDACLRFFENRRAVHTPSSEQVRRPINSDGLHTWRNYEKWLGPLKQALGPALHGYRSRPSKPAD
ncbi:MAG: sulfotransferase [Sphingobium sp.]